MRLVADCGNTCVKLAVFDRGVLLAHARLEPEITALSAWSESWDGKITEIVVSPGAALTTQMVQHWWHAYGNRRPIRMIGGTNELDLPVPALGQYASCGIDRVLAGFAAGIAERQSVVVIDGGTATTITAWLVKPEIPDPIQSIRFAGGLILPGARACVAGLVARAPALPLVDPLGPDASARQHDTANAIAAAIGIGYGPMVAACMLKLQRETNIHHEVVTGGEVEQFLAARIVHQRTLRPSLLLEGVDRWCRYCDR